MTPEGWSAETLADLAKLITKGTTPTTNGHAYTAAGIPFLRVESITDQGSLDLSQVKFISEATHMSLARSQLQPGDVLFSIAGALGRACIVPDTVPKANINQAVALIRLADASRDHISPAFLKYELHGYVVAQQVRLVAAQLAQANLNLKQVGELRLLLPPLGEQRKIAAILASVDDAIEGTQAVIDQLQVVKKAMMAELLTRGLPGRHTTFKQTEIGEVPRDWKVVQLGSLLADVHAGWSPQCESSPAGEAEWGVLKVSAVSWDEFRAGENKRLPATLDHRPEIEVKAGDLLVSRANTPDLVGRSVYVVATRPLLMLSDKIMRLVPDRQRADPRFINFVLGASASRDQIENAATGSSRSMKNLSQEKLRGVLVAAPPLDEQAQIMSLVDATSARMLMEREFLATIQNLKAALMSVLLTGEVRVTPTEVA